MDTIRNFVASESAIEALTTSLLTAVAAAEGERRTYLRCLVGTTIDELGASQRVRMAAPGRLSEEEIAGQLAAFEKVNTRFYTAVIKAASAALPAGTEKPRELNRRTNFARTSASALRGWIRAGKDVTTLAAARVTKSALVVERPKAKRARVTPAQLRAQIGHRAKALLADVRTLMRADRELAIGQLQSLIGQFARLTGATPTRDVDTAIAEGRPLQTKGAVFVPMTTQ